MPSAVAPVAAVAATPATAGSAPVAQAPVAPPADDGRAVHAGPAVRRLARELGVVLSAVTGSGPRGRIVKDDVHAWVKMRLSQPAPAAPAASGGLPGFDLPPEPDYAKWGAVELKPRSRIQRKSAENLARSALIVPAFTAASPWPGEAAKAAATSRVSRGPA